MLRDARVRTKLLAVLAIPTLLLVAVTALLVAASVDGAQGWFRALTIVVVGLAVTGLGLTVLLAAVLVRRITGPLRHLTAAAARLGGVGDGSDAIPDRSGDEVGRLVAAFNTMAVATGASAREQAALRTSLTEMCANLCRRNQVLIAQQRAALSTMAAGEEDHAVLDRLGGIDHLATRMRRNAESLLVLAGVESSRRLRAPRSLSHLIRTAVGEIESFDRVDLALAQDYEVPPRHALDLVHLLAELVENATVFSNPDTRVVVRVAPAGTGVELSVTDLGLGMSDHQLDAANASTAGAPLWGAADLQRLGLLVVGRLAARLDAVVTVRAGRPAGTVVTVSLPSSVFDGNGADHAAGASIEEGSEPAPEVAGTPLGGPPEQQEVTQDTPRVPLSVAPTPSVDVLPDAVRSGGRFGRGRSTEPPPAAVVPHVVPAARAAPTSAARPQPAQMSLPMAAGRLAAALSKPSAVPPADQPVLSWPAPARPAPPQPAAAGPPPHPSPEALTGSSIPGHPASLAGPEPEA